MASGYKEFDDNGVPMVMRFLKSVHSLRQSPRYWYNTVDKHLVELKSDPCVYIYSEGGAIYILTLYVDEVRLLRKDRRVLESIKGKLVECFSMANRGRHVVGARDGNYP